MPSKMYVWKVKLEVQIQFVVNSKETGKQLRVSKDIEQQEYTVASPTGFRAIERASKLALDKSGVLVDDWSDENENWTSTPIKVTDVVELALESELDG